MTGTAKGEVWRALEAHRDEIDSRHPRELVAKDPGRFDRLGLEAAGLFLDCAKQHVTDETLALEDEMVQLCQRQVTIPMSRGTDSLNAAVASGVFLYHFERIAK